MNKRTLYYQQTKLYYEKQTVRFHWFCSMCLSVCFKEPFSSKKEPVRFHWFVSTFYSFSKKEAKQKLGIIGFVHCFGVICPVLFPLVWGSFSGSFSTVYFFNVFFCSPRFFFRFFFHLLRPPLTNTTQKYTLDYYCCYYYLLLY